MRFKKIHQLLHTLSYGDAISGEALALARFFRSQGIESEIFALNIDPKYRDQARFFSELQPDFDGAVILHYSLGSPLNDFYRRLKGTVRYLIYHNLTPAGWFHGVNPRIVKDINAGLVELPDLCRVTDYLIADSEFNAGELSKLGFKAEVLELTLDPKRWEIEVNSGINSLLSSQTRLNFMHVGRLAPNKCIEDIIKAFYFLHHKIDKNSHLWLVGIDIDTEVYSFALKRLVYELSLSENVSFVGRFVDSELKALYQNSHVYLCMSEHEGFCMPVIEAMHFKVPVVAYNSSALPYTMREAGILINRKQHEKIAEIAYRAATDGALRQRLIETGLRRAAELSYERFSEKASSIFVSPKLESSSGTEALRA